MIYLPNPSDHHVRLFVFYKIADLIRSGQDLTHVADAIKDGHRAGALNLAKLRDKLDTVAHRPVYEDGNELLENLLDLVGLSTAGLAVSTAKSPVGQLIAATAIQQNQTVLFDQFSTPTLRDGVAEVMKQVMASAKAANVATPVLTSGEMEPVELLYEAMLGAFKDDPRKVEHGIGEDLTEEKEEEQK